MYFFVPQVPSWAPFSFLHQSLLPCQRTSLLTPSSRTAPRWPAPRPSLNLQRIKVTSFETMRLLCNSLTRWTFARPYVLQHGCKSYMPKQQQHVLTNRKFSTISIQLSQATELYKCNNVTTQSRYLCLQPKNASHPLVCHSFYNRDSFKRFYRWKIQ